MSTFEKLAQLTDPEAEAVLNRVIEGYSALHPEFPLETDALSLLFTRAASAAAQPVPPAADLAISNRASAERTLLVELARNPETSQRIDQAIETNRDVLIEPVTAALVMAGVVLVLQLNFEMQFTRKDGKTDFEVSISKKPTSDSLIGKLFGFFS